MPLGGLQRLHMFIHAITQVKASKSEVSTGLYGNRTTLRQTNSRSVNSRTS